MQKKYSAIDHLDGLELVRTRDIPQDVRGINTFQGIGQRGSLDLTVFADTQTEKRPGTEAQPTAWVPLLIP